MEGFCKRGHPRAKFGVYYVRKSGKEAGKGNLQCKACINAARRLRYRNDIEFREKDKLKSNSYYHKVVKVRANGQESSDNSSS